VSSRLATIALIGFIVFASCAPVWEEGRETPAVEKAERTVALDTEVLRKQGNFLRVRAFGSISSDDPLCVDTQEIVVQARRRGAATWQGLGSQLTDDVGNYSIALEVRRDEELQAVASRFDYCKREVSPSVKPRG
jgi:hypothetical protein